ncbi:MAG TPA: alpha/beta hydrolase-fold protein, partial [Candidatus Sulfomarinibacteraceae bacterium]|nr:alpha/beta hydrolase-fold protein [Candidatus Sulfomarinibacteraceae bacterium]
YGIYLPPGYEASTDRYPVIYFLGGVSLDTPSPVVEKLDEMISTGLIEPTILVNPCGDCAAPGVGRWLEFPEVVYESNFMDSELFGAHDTYLAVDVVNHIDSTYRTIADRDHRGITGHSRNSLWAVRAALWHPDVFGGAAALGSVLDWRGFEFLCGSIAASQGFRPIDEYEPEPDSTLKSMLSVAATYLPAPDLPPWYLDYPCTQNGQPIPALWDTIDVQTARGVAEQLAVQDLRLRLGIFAAIGDQFGADHSAQRFADVLVSQEAAHTLRLYETTEPDPHGDIRPPMFLTFLNPMPSATWLSPTTWDSGLGSEVVAQIELPAGLDPADVDPGSVVISEIGGQLLFEPVAATVAVVGDGLQATFDAGEAVAAGSPYPPGIRITLEITVRGEMTDGRFFAGSDTVTLVRAATPVDPPPVALE